MQVKTVFPHGDVSVEVVLDAQVLHEMLRFAQIPHFDIKVVASSQER